MSASSSTWWAHLRSPHTSPGLFYVACTRAKDTLIFTHTRMRGGRQTGGPSRFLAEAGLLGGQRAALAA